MCASYMYDLSTLRLLVGYESQGLTLMVTLWCMTRMVSPGSPTMRDTDEAFIFGALNSTISPRRISSWVVPTGQIHHLESMESLQD